MKKRHLILKVRISNLILLLSVGVIVVLTGCGVGLIFTGFANGTKPLSNYYFEGYSKSNLNFAIKRFIIENPEYYIRRDTLGNFMEHYAFKTGSNDPFIREMNSDSVCFHFRLKYNDTTTVLFWTQISGLTQHWSLKKTPYNIKTELLLIGISDDFKIWKGDASKPKPSMRDKKKMKIYIKDFELRVLPKIRSQLKAVE